MDEERPIREARAAMKRAGDGDPPATDAGRDRGPGASPGRSNRLLIGGIILVVGLIIAGLLLPPISLLQRFAGGPEVVDQEPVVDPSVPATGDIPGVIVVQADDGSAVGVELVDLASLDAAAASLPAHARLMGDVFRLSRAEPAAAGEVTVTLPAGQSAGQLDLYAWTGGRWQFVPVSEAGDSLVMKGPLPEAVALMLTTAPASRVVAAELLPTQSLPAAVLPLLTDLTVGTLTLNNGGRLEGALAGAPGGRFRQFIRVTNRGVIVDEASLRALLSDASFQKDMIDDLLTRVNQGGYAGVNLDFQGVAPAQGAAFTRLVQDLAAALRAANASLAITLAPPPVAGDGFDTGGQDWAALGAAADLVYLQLPLDPRLYGDQGEADRLVRYALRRIERTRLVLSSGASAVDLVEGGAFVELPGDQALANFGELAFVQGGVEIEPGATVEVSLTGSASPLEWDRDSVAYRYSYSAADQVHTVWLSNESALSHRLRFANAYGLKGIGVRGLSAGGPGQGFAQAMSSFLGQAEPPQPAAAGIVWTVEDESGGIVASATGEAVNFIWEATESPGVYLLRVDFAQGDSVASLGHLELAVTAPEVVEEAPPEETPTPEAVAAAPTPTPAPAVASGSFSPGDADAVTNVTANVRTGPGLVYSTIAGGAPAGTRVAVIGRNADASWLQVRLPSDQEGWIFARLLNLNTRVNVSGLSVVEVPPPPTSGGGGGSAGGGGAPAPIPAGTFALGGQTHSFANPTLMAYAGMTWVKFQHKWGEGDSPNAVAGRINQAHANGFKVLLSIPGANTYPGSINFAPYIEFLRGVAALGPDAIEVWNEMNIDFEWPAGQINPTSYVNNMLAPAYNAIKGANRNVMVISGAPAPTGFDNGTNAWADARYMAGMAAAGGANFMDCIGVHYNEGILSPSQTSGDPRVPSNYHTRYFWGMVNTYWNAFGGARPLCFTELGYLSGEGYPGLPANFSWAGGTSIGEHAAWLAEAASLSASSGKVRMMIIFNVDFTYYDPNGDPQAGYAMIRADGSCPACETLRRVTGGR